MQMTREGETMEQETLGKRAAKASLRLNMTKAQRVAILTLLSSRTDPDRLDTAFRNLVEVARAARETFKTRGDRTMEAEALALQAEASLALARLGQLHPRRADDVSPLMRAFDGEA
jgi:endonuclease III